MQSLSLRPYRVGLNVTELEASAQKALKLAEKLEDVQKFLNWSSKEEVDYLKAAFTPQHDVKEFWYLWHGIQKQRKLRDKRIQKGFLELNGERRGLRGWWQKFSDKKERELPINIELLAWLKNTPRLGILSALHDSLLQGVMIGDASEVSLEEITAIPHPWSEMIYQLDKERAHHIVAAMKAPLFKVSPKFLIHGVMNYVIYQPSRGFAYYYA